MKHLITLAISIALLYSCIEQHTYHYKIEVVYTDGTKEIIKETSSHHRVILKNSCLTLADGCIEYPIRCGVRSYTILSTN